MHGDFRLRHPSIFGFARLCACFLALTGAFLTGGQAQAAEPEYSLGPNDILQITVFGETDLSGEFKVSSAGVISMPLIGDVRAGDLTMKQLESKIIAKLTPDFLINPRVSVQVLNFRKFCIQGEVRRADCYEYQPGLTVLKAIALAGGYSYRARKTPVEIKRGRNATAAPVEVNSHARVFPGDVITVKERFF